MMTEQQILRFLDLSKLRAARHPVSARGREYYRGMARALDAALALTGAEADAMLDQIELGLLRPLERELVATCSVCGEPVYHDERKLSIDGKWAHSDCCYWELQRLVEGGTWSNDFGPGEENQYPTKRAAKDDIHRLRAKLTPRHFKMRAVGPVEKRRNVCR